MTVVQCQLGIADAIQTLSETSAIPLQNYRKGYPFRLVGHVGGRIGSNAFVLADETNRLLINTAHPVSDRISPGDRVRVIGQTIVDNSRRSTLWATNVTVLDRGPAPAPAAITIDRLACGDYDLRPVVLRGLVTDLFHDDIARLLSLSKARVKQHLNAIYEKLGASNRAEAVAIALRKRLLKI